MKVKELVELLLEQDQELDVVLTTADETHLTAYKVRDIDLGWEPSGVLSINAGECVLA